MSFEIQLRIDSNKVQTNALSQLFFSQFVSLLCIDLYVR